MCRFQFKIIYISILWELSYKFLHVSAIPIDICSLLTNANEIQNYHHQITHLSN
jgi:hypothetical protein